MTTQQASSIVDGSIVASIQALGLPALAVHPDWVNDWQVDSFTTYLGELFLACSLKACTTGSAIERFTLLPSEKVTKAVNAIHYLPGKLVEAGCNFLKETPDDSMHLLLSWITFQSELHVKAIHSEFLTHILQQRPKGGGFAKLYFLNQVLQTKVADYCDSVKTSPSTKPVHNAIDELLPLLQGKSPETLDAPAIREKLSPLQDEKYSVYQYPTDEELNTGAFPEFCRLLDETPDHHSLYLERGILKSLQKNNKSWAKENIEWDSAIHIQENFHLSFLRQAGTGKRIHVSSAIFNMVAENVSEACIFRAAKTYLLYMELMALAGNLDPAIVAQQKAIIQAFLMNLEFGRGCDEQEESDKEKDNETVLDEDVTVPEDYQKLYVGQRDARLRIMPKGYFWGTPKNLMAVSRSLRVHYCVAIMLYEEMGEENFRLLLIAHALMGTGPCWDNGYQGLTPLHPQYVCEGKPASPNLPSRPCEQFANTYICRVGARSEDHIFDGMIMCNRCLGGLKPWEYDMLDHMHKTRQTLSPAQTKRLDEMIESKKERATYQQLRVQKAGGGDDESIIEISVSSKDGDDDSEEEDSDEEPDSKWESRFVLYEELVAETGISDPQQAGNKPGTKYFELNHWATMNRSRKHRLKKHQIMRLDQLGFPWEATRVYNEKDEMIEIVGKLYQAHKKSRLRNKPFKITQAYKTLDGLAVGMWFYNQKRNKFRGLTAEQKERLDELLEWA